MREKLRLIIQQEDHKNPHTDVELCKKLSVSREYVTTLRKEMRILDSRERKKTYLLDEIKALLKNKPNMSEQEIWGILKKQGIQLSKYLLDKYLRNASVKLWSDFAFIPEAEAESEYQSFLNLVGADGSLEVQIQQAKAAMLYPPNGLHCLILGETGVGKSELAEAMYRFALESGSLPPSAPFTVFNCADYAENAQLLMAQLFGCVKGAYTGAVSDRKGLVEQVDGGILFLDEVHRLSSEGQEMLFQLIDKGNYRRLGESDAIRQAKVQLIAATTENVETSLLGTFKRRIPMLINVPPLVERPLTERLQLINKFFGCESSRMNAPLHVALDAIKALLLYDCQGNIGQLKSDIQVTCAKSFLAYVTKKEKVVTVQIHNLSLYVKKGLMKINTKRHEIDAIVWSDIRFSPTQYQNASQVEEDIYSFPKEFYGYIEKVHSDCLAQGIDVQQIKHLIGDEIEKKLQHVITHVKHRLTPLPLDEIGKVVGDDIIRLVKDILQIAEAALGKMDESIFYCLAIHLNATFARLKQGREIINPNLEEIKEKFVKEYAVARQMADHIETTYGCRLPEDEIGYIALYLHGNVPEEEGQVGIVVATHGNVGTCMLDIANKLLNISHGKALSMTFEESPQSALERLVAFVQESDEGKGVLILVDMGSLLTFGEIIQQRTKIQVKTMDRVDTVMVIEALRRSILPGANLNDIVYGIEHLNYTFQNNMLLPKLDMKPKAILTVCLTGEGIALYCGRRLKELLGDAMEHFMLFHMGVLGEKDIDEQIQEVMRTYDVIAIIGSVDPKIKAVPYMKFDELLCAAGEKRLRKIVGIQRFPNSARLAVPSVPNEVAHLKTAILEDRAWTKEEVLAHLCRLLDDANCVKPGYFEAVCEREAMGSYLINQRVALPHADGRYVLEPTVLVARLPRPILWDQANVVRIICLLALDENGKDSVRFLYKQFQDETVLNRLERAETTEKIKEALTHVKHSD